MLHSQRLPIRLGASPLKMMGMVAGGLVFVFIGIDTFDSNDSYWPFALFGLCAIVGAIGLLPGSTYLELTQDGFTVSSLYQKSFITWTQVEEFVVCPRSRGGDLVGWNSVFVPGEKTMGHHLSAAIADMVGAPSGGVLPDTYGMKASELEELLNSILRARKSSERRGRDAL
jgi:hypothetical protein